VRSFPSMGRGHRAAICDRLGAAQPERPDVQRRRQGQQELFA
jgi:hypothetical protein